MIAGSVCIHAGPLMLEQRTHRLLIIIRDVESFQILQASFKQKRIIFRVLVLSADIHSEGGVFRFESR